jgi:hypothetical protein
VSRFYPSLSSQKDKFNIVEAVEAYGRGAFGPVQIPLSAADRVIAIGSDGMMAAAAEARQAGLKRYCRPRPPRDRLDQLADAVHDEGDLRARQNEGGYRLVG